MKRVKKSNVATLRKNLLHILRLYQAILVVELNLTKIILHIDRNWTIVTEFTSSL